MAEVLFEIVGERGFADGFAVERSVREVPGAQPFETFTCYERLAEGTTAHTFAGSLETLVSKLRPEVRAQLEWLAASGRRRELYCRVPAFAPELAEQAQGDLP